ncbi:hypothetical protein HMPREF9120_01322 [Neisseria sp. oral taxon 020 str. F0370]|nr:hypothetical protein HMPREF9120_01322 [Neisseria sp. oral taxon 020 str. F0370]
MIAASTAEQHGFNLNLFILFSLCLLRNDNIPNQPSCRRMFSPHKFKT